MLHYTTTTMLRLPPSLQLYTDYILIFMFMMGLWCTLNISNVPRSHLHVHVHVQLHVSPGSGGGHLSDQGINAVVSQLPSHDDLGAVEVIMEAVVR